MSKNIEHKGVIATIAERHVVVRVVQQSACASCQMSGHCHSADARDRLVDIQVDDADDYSVGERVIVYAPSSVGYLSVFWGLGLPLLLMLTVIAFVRFVKGNDVQAALWSLASVTVYYVALGFFRRKMRRVVSFHVRKVS